MRGRFPFSRDWYVLGSAPLNLSAARVQDGEDAFRPVLNASRFAPQLLDHGFVYASKSFSLSDGRRVVLGWAYEDAAGCTELCADGTPFTRLLGWQGVQVRAQASVTGTGASCLLIAFVFHLPWAWSRGVHWGWGQLCPPHRLPH